MSSIRFPEEPLPPEYFTADRSSLLLWLGVVTTVIELAVFVARIVSRRLSRAKRGWDDVFAIPSMVACIALNIMAMGKSAILFWFGLD